MRLWSIHPKYLDCKGLVACWREGLLAQAVLEGKTKGYKNHPQLDRFRAVGGGIYAINAYLHYLVSEAKERGYKFNTEKLRPFEEHEPMISVTNFQVGYEWGLLQYKIAIRKGEKIERFNPYLLTCEEAQNIVHPIFKVIPGRVEYWEKIKEFGS